MKYCVYFPYFTEIFILFQLLGWTRANWWWIVVFILSDLGSSQAFKDFLAKGSK